jgi:hypothetical protein
MTQQIINIGSTPNDRTGDTMVVGATKINANFSELYRLVNDRSIIQANALGGTTLASNVVASSLTSVGTLTNLSVTNAITGSINGNARTVTNGVYSNVSYHDPAWVASLNYNKITGFPLGFNSTPAGVGPTGALGGVKVDGSTITIDVNGVISSFSTYTLPVASQSTLGGVRVDGTTVVMNGNVLSAISAIGTAAAGALTGTTLAANVVNSSLTSIGTLTALSVTGNSNLGGDLYLSGNLTVNGTTTTINSTTLSVDDKNIELGSIASPSDITADGGGITLKGTTNKTITWLSSTGRWTFNTAVEATSFVGNASTATKLAATKSINGVAFDGSADITVAVDASTLSGNTLNSTITSSSLTSVGTLANLTVTNPIAGSVTGSAATLTTSRNINGVAFNGSADITVAAAAGTLSGSILAGNVLSSSLTSVGTIVTGTWNATAIGPTKGGTGLSAYTSGDIIYASATNVLSRLAKGVNGQVLTLVAGFPAYADVPVYTLPTSSTSTLGGVKVDGTTITINGSGIISSTGGYSLPVASTTVLGGVKIDGSTITLNGSNQLVATAYSLPTATVGTLSTGTLGGVKVDGTTITITNGVISGANTYTLPAASTSTLGGVTVAAVGTSGLNNTSGAISLATAGTSQLGGVKIDGTTITIDGSGVISSASGLTSRGTVAGTTASLANNATGNLTIAGFKGYVLYKIQTSAGAWVRIYTDGSSRTADAGRAQTSDPSPGSGVIAEVITSGAQTIVVGPGTIGFNNESSPTTNIELAVTNLSGSTATVTVTLTILKIEV